MPGKRVHFIGVGGAGMSALARYFLSQNWAVSGSDIDESPTLARLGKVGLKVKIGQKRGHIMPGMTLVVYSQAIQQNNPELKEARRLGIRTLSYPEIVGDLTRQYKTIAVSGAHGKSTTTALVALVLEKGKLDPTVIMGANLKEFCDGNFRSGKGDYFVLEADEFGRAFLHYSPTYAVITNIDREHLDVYKDLADIKKTFFQFLGNVREGRTIIINRDDENCYSLKKQIIELGHRKKAWIIWYSLRDPVVKKIRRIIQIPGNHNISNALAAYYIGRTLGIAEKNILAAIGAYHGISRRMEYRGELKMTSLCRPRGGEDPCFRNLKISVYDDYAHHPTEIKVTLRAFREKFPKAPIICVFQPHQAKRLTALFREFQRAFDDADSTILLPVYKVAGRDKDFLLDSEALVHAIQRRKFGKPIFYLNDPKKLKTVLNALFSSPKLYPSKPKTAVVVMMGAGDIFHYTDLLLKK